MFADPRVLAFVALIVGTFLLWTRVTHLCRIVVRAVIVLTVFLIIVPVGDKVLAPLKRRWPTDRTVGCRRNLGARHVGARRGTG